MVMYAPKNELLVNTINAVNEAESKFDNGFDPETRKYIPWGKYFIIIEVLHPSEIRLSVSKEDYGVGELVAVYRNGMATWKDITESMAVLLESCYKINLNSATFRMLSGW